MEASAQRLRTKWAEAAEQKPIGKLDLHLCLEGYVIFKTFGASALGFVWGAGLVLKNT